MGSIPKKKKKKKKTQLSAIYFTYKSNKYYT
jgi:hypothetical protein